MAKRKSRIATDDISKAGAVGIGTANTEGNVDYEVNNLEVQSKTKLEEDVGDGRPVILRKFEFGMNPTAWQQYRPTKQELFNYHLKGIEIALWKDGLKPMPDVNPRIVVDSQNMKYQIFVAAEVARGHLLNANPLTLKQLTSG